MAGREALLPEGGGAPSLADAEVSPVAAPLAAAAGVMVGVGCWTVGTEGEALETLGATKKNLPDCARIEVHARSAQRLIWKGPPCGQPVDGGETEVVASLVSTRALSC